MLHTTSPDAAAGSRMMSAGHSPLSHIFGTSTSKGDDISQRAQSHCSALHAVSPVSSDISPLQFLATIPLPKSTEMLPAG